MIHDVHNLSIQVQNTTEFWDFFQQNKNTFVESHKDDRTFMYTFLFVIVFFSIFCYCGRKVRR